MCFDKFEGTDIKYGNSFLSSGKKYLNKAFWFHAQSFFVLHQTLHLINSKALISIVFSNSFLNLSKKLFLEPSFKFLLFWMEIWTFTNFRVNFSNVTIVCRPKIWDILVLNIGSFHFSSRICTLKNSRAFIPNMTIAFSNSYLKNFFTLLLDQ